MNSATGPPLPKICTKTIKNVYKNYAKQLICIYSIYKDCTNLNFVWYWIYKKCTSNSYIYIYIYIQQMYKRYKTCTKFRLKTDWDLKCMFIVYTNNVQTIKNLYN